MKLETAKSTAEFALAKGRKLYFYKARNGQWMMDSRKDQYPNMYESKEFLAKFC